jgi:hypothetical protein
MRSIQEAGGVRVRETKRERQRERERERERVTKREREYCKHDSHGTKEPGRATRAVEVIEYKSVIMKIRLIG